jgi:hypothetical protein
VSKLTIAQRQNQPEGSDERNNLTALIKRLEASRETFWGVEAALRLLADSEEDLRAFIELLAENLKREGDTLEECHSALGSLLKSRTAVA